MARPRKRTPTAQERILEALRLGATYQRAAAAAGLSYDTLHRMMQENREFCEQVKEAEAVCAQAALKAIQKAARAGTWQAAAWILERRYPGEYGRTVQEHTGEQKLVVEYRRNWRGNAGTADGEDTESEESGGA